MKLAPSLSGKGRADSRGLGFLIAILLAPSLARADNYVDVTGAQFKPLPIAIEQSWGEAALSDPFTTTVREDLALCGYFDVLNPSSFLVDATKESNVLGEIDFTKWRAVGATNLAKASITRHGNEASVDVWLFDVNASTQMVRMNFVGPADDIKTLGHKWANLIVKTVTGLDGYFLTRIAFVRPSGRDKHLWVADFDGRHAVDLTPGGGLNLLPSWSPDGKYVAFTSFRDGSPMLYLADVTTKKITPLPKRGSLDTGAAFSPDGKHIAFTMSEHGNANICLMNSDGTGLKALTDGRDTNSSTAWSPDGKHIAYVSTHSGDPQIFMMNADGTGPQRLTFQGRYNQTPDWSPRGDEIAFTARDERNVFDIFAVNVDKKTIHRLTQDAGQNEEPSYAPNGNSIIFTSTRTGRSQIWLMNRDGTNQHPLLLHGEALTPSWGPITPDQSK